MTPPFLFQWIRQAGIRQSTAMPFAMTSQTDVVAEAEFAKILRLERCRAERSCKRLMMVLINSEDFRGKSGRRVASRVAGAVAARVRETDVLGWYQQGASLGVLFTETGSLDAVGVRKIMFKITHELKQKLSAEDFQRLALEYHLYPQDQETRDSKRPHDGFYPDLSARQVSPLQAGGAKRMMDVAGSLAALIILLPLFLIIALLVKFTSKGPVLFSQQRVGRGGHLFTFFKFRTMYTNNDPSVHREYVVRLIAGGAVQEAGGGLYKLTSDPRITSVGRWLRKSSLDEMPQFLNVLLGDMSLVGPRPPLPYEFERYKIWHKRRVMELKPGLTGPWQIGGRSTTTFDEMVRMDLRYLKSKSIWTDCMILLRTPAAVVSGRGAC